MKSGHVPPRALLVTLGDPNGIGPEVAIRSLASSRPALPVILIGPRSSIHPWQRCIGRTNRPRDISVAELREKSFSGGFYLIDTAERGYVPQPGRITNASARTALQSLAIATDLLCAYPDRFALVTAPLSKEAILRAGVKFSGHTGYIGDAFGIEPLMLLMAGTLRVGLVTEHIPICDVARRITAQSVMSKLRILSDGIRDMGISARPDIAVLGLNPHAGEGGRIGREDTVIGAAIRQFNRRRGSGHAFGPLAGDAALAKWAEGAIRPDAVLAMYHDQGLIPVKMLGIHRAVNITVGLPAWRTSPAHGTAFDIAGRGIADPRSMSMAVAWAARLLRQNARA